LLLLFRNFDNEEALPHRGLSRQKQTKDSCSVSFWSYLERRVGVWTGLIWLRLGPVLLCYECGHEPLGSVKGEDFLEELNDH